jgi:uncharacterized membrane protein YkvA (DUF1232 family)
VAGHTATSASLVAAITWWQGLLWMLLILVAAWVVLLLVLVMLGRGGLARTTARLVPDLLVLFRRLLGDRRVPRRSKVAVALTLAYLAMPLDIVPDFIPVAGQLDDVIVVGLALRYALRRAGPALVREHWPGSPEGLKLVLQLAGCAHWSDGGPDADARRPPDGDQKRDDRRDS